MEFLTGKITWSIRFQKKKNQLSWNWVFDSFFWQTPQPMYMSNLLGSIHKMVGWGETKLPSLKDGSLYYRIFGNMLQPKYIMQKGTRPCQESDLQGKNNDTICQLGTDRVLDKHFLAQYSETFPRNINGNSSFCRPQTRRVHGLVKTTVPIYFFR